MIIDTHCHIWSYDKTPYYNDLPVYEYIKANKIDKISLICMNDAENQRMRQLVKNEPNIFFGVAYVNFQRMDESLQKLRDWVCEGTVKAVKIYPYFEHFRVDDPQLYKFYETTVELSLPVIPHLGWVYMDTDASCGHSGKYKYTGFPEQYGTVMENFPNLKLVVTHLGGNYYYEFLTMAERFPSIVMETAWLPDYCMRQFPPKDMFGWIEHAISFLGSERIIYGGEGVFPKDIERLGISDTAKENILGKNAVKYFNIT